MLLEHFTNVEDVVLGETLGVEVETDFRDTATGGPIDERLTGILIDLAVPRPTGVDVTYDTGRQKIELGIGPYGSWDELHEATMTGLRWLYNRAAHYGAYPVHGPEFEHNGPLLYPASERDRTWVRLDGARALELLARISSVQYSIAVPPAQAVEVVNALLAANLDVDGYAPNDRNWRRYIAESRARYLRGRYGGPEQFIDLADYCAELRRHEAVMHQGRPVRHDPDQLGTPAAIEAYLSTVWWHDRLRVRTDPLSGRSVLTVEARHFGRGTDDKIDHDWKDIATTLNL